MRLHPVDLKKIHINDAFWSKHVSLVKEVVIPYQWDAINDRIKDAEPSHSLMNFKIAAGLCEGEFYGAVFQDTDVAKWLEAVGFSLAAQKDEALERTADEVIDIIAKAQCEDGYLNTYFTIKEPGKRWGDLCEGHELYTAGHMMEAAVAYYLGTGKQKFLEVMVRFADLICDTFGVQEGKIHGYPGHQEVEIGLIKLYQVTGERRYLEQAKYFIDARGVGENYFLKELNRPGFSYIFPEFKDYEPIYSQSHLPVRGQRTAEGHAVRAMYMYSAMADLAEACEDETLMEACCTLWDNMTQKRMYITGSIGSSGILERFTTDYDLPNDCNYSESCASIGMAMFGQRMGNITGEAKYYDVVERALYNTVLAGIALDGKSFFYVNPLEVWPDNCIPRTSREHVKPVRQKWFGVACCPPNIARTLASLGQYIYGADQNSLYVNLFISNQTSVDLGGREISVQMQTRFPWDMSVDIACKGVPASGIRLAVRIPDYAGSFTVTKAGTQQPLAFSREKGYAVISLTEDAGLRIEMDAKARFVRSNPLVRADSGKVALVRGPIVYCLEEVDNGPNLAAVYVDSGTEIKEEKWALMGEITGLTLSGKRISAKGWGDDELYGLHPVVWEDVKLKAVPYAYWNNRGTGEMIVWVKELLKA
ncbi:glycoside hydrolase family 127 protein [Enterocloster citroniae]|uniref:glycoside hydrolase family 127 protein n=1 Tax=Enterocloster citroniae TaxID=358743 RepID=UPI00189BFA84|nr:beta-L-arabinofuranosidase domain-containing protein [Enterocloster citroniae]